MVSIANLSLGAEIAPKHGLDNVSHDKMKLEGWFWGGTPRNTSQNHYPANPIPANVALMKEMVC